MRLRYATPGDIPAIVRMAKAFYESSRFPFPFSVEHFSVTSSDFISSNNKLCLVMGEPAKAVFMAQYGVSQASPIRVADEFLIWADPDVRRGVLQAFIEEYEKWASSHGCHSCQISAQSQVRPAAMTRAFARYGYSPSDIRHIKKI